MGGANSSFRSNAGSGRAILSLHPAGIENNNQPQPATRRPTQMSFSVLIIGAAMVLAIIVIAGILVAVNRSGRDQS